MAPHLIAPVVALAATGAIVWWKGGEADRTAFTPLAAAFIVSPLLQQRSAWTARQVPDFIVDLALLIALGAIAVRSRRSALTFLASLQTIYVLLYIPFWIWPASYYRAFYYAGVVLGYLQELVLVVSALMFGRRSNNPLLNLHRRNSVSAR